MTKLRIFIGVMLLSLLTLVAGACAETIPATAPAKENVNFRFLISDDVNAIGDFTSVNVTISSIGLQQGGESGNWTTITPDITEVDLKPLSGENALEVWSGNITPGEYSKVFIYVSDVRGTLTDNSTANVKLPSEKLQISKPFTVSENETTSFVYDITVVKAGQSGQYILQPQIAQSGANQEFTEVEHGKGKGKELEESGRPEGSRFQGTIKEIDDTTWTVKIEGESWTVDISEAEVDGEPALGLEVKIKGTVGEDELILASEVEIEEAEEEVLEFEGMITAIDGDIWTVTIVDEDRTVDVSNAEIEGVPEVGSQVHIEGVEENGTIIAEDVEVEDPETEE